MWPGSFSLVDGLFSVGFDAASMEEMGMPMCDTMSSRKEFGFEVD